MLSAIIFALFSGAVIAQTPTPEFDDVLLDLGNNAVAPWAGQECNAPTHWIVDADIPDGFGDVLSGTDLWVNVGVQFGCHQVDKMLGLAAQAKKTHTIAYAGGLTPISAFTFNFAANADLDGAEAGNYEKVDVSAAVGYVASTITRIVELDAQGNVSAALQFNSPWLSFMTWEPLPVEEISDGVYRMGFVAHTNSTLLGSIDLFQVFNGLLNNIAPNFRLTFEYFVSEKYGFLETDPPSPLSALGAEVVLTIENWSFQNANHHLGVEFITMQKPTVAKFENDAYRMDTTDQDPWSGSYFHFPTKGQQLASTADAAGTPTELNITPEHLDLDNVPLEDVEIDIVGNPIMAVQAAAFFGVTTRYSSDICSFHRVTVSTKTVNLDSIRIEAGFGIGKYPYEPEAPPTCEDGFLNQEETGVDCGGPNCDPCPDGCHYAPSRYCLNCNDGMLNGDEVSVDCDGTVCTGVCPTCNDFTKNGDEEGVDCGGTKCEACPQGCANGVLDDGEDGIDCGGSCRACGPGEISGESAAPATLLLNCFAALAVIFNVL